MQQLSFISMLSIGQRHLLSFMLTISCFILVFRLIKIFFLLMNNAKGGGFEGTMDIDFTSSTFEKDYLRVYN